jgi:hypothetical protein
LPQVIVERAPLISASTTAERTAFRILSRVSLVEISFKLAGFPFVSITCSVMVPDEANEVRNGDKALPLR